MAAATLRIGNYVLGETLGNGTFGKVKLAEHRLTGHKVAVKIISRDLIQNMDVGTKVKREIQILKLFRHPHIIKLYEVIDTPTDIFMIMEYVSGGEMFEYIVKHGRTSEDIARRFFQQIISGVAYCHEHMIVHRDLKPENLLLDENLNVKIADFGLSNIMVDGDFLSTSCGSPNYAAPEVVSGKLYAGPEVDLWSCGVVLYALLCGRLPFDDEYVPNLFKKIKAGMYSIPEFLSADAKDLVVRMLQVDPLKRITMEEVRNHAWFRVNLAPYLAVSQATGVESIDVAVVKDLCRRLNITEEEAMAALKAGDMNEVLVAYRLIVDSKNILTVARDSREKTIPSIMLATSPPAWDFQEDYLDTPGIKRTGSGMTNTINAEGNSFGSTPRRFHLGYRTRKDPGIVMGEIYQALLALNLEWATIGVYNVHARRKKERDPDAEADDMETGRVVSGLTEAVRASASTDTTESLPLKSKKQSLHSDPKLRDISKAPERLRISIQVYKVDAEYYVVDFRRCAGAVFPFFELCAEICELLQRA